MRKKLNQKKTLFCVSILVLCFLWQLHQNRPVQVIVRNSEGAKFSLHMPLKDKKRLTYLFQSMIVWDSAGYTLLGNKPMSLTSFYRPFSFVGWEIFMASVKPGNLRKYFAWKTWEKYQHLLENSKFLMWTEENLFFDNPNYLNPSVFIVFVHQANLEKIVSLYEADFQEGLKRDDVSGRQLLLEARDRPFLKTVLGGNEQLIGTLLGYGRDNARLFVERKNGKEAPLTFIWDERIWGKEIDNVFKNRPYFQLGLLGHMSQQHLQCVGVSYIPCRSKFYRDTKDPK